MRNRCGRNGQGSVGVRLRSAADAAAAIRLSAGGDDESIVFLICDDDDRILLAVDFAGAPASGVAEAADCVLDAVLESTALVVGIVRPHDPGTFDAEEAEAIDELIGSCQVADVYLRAVIVVTGGGWRSVADVAFAGFGENNGHQ